MKHLHFTNGINFIVDNMAIAEFYDSNCIGIGGGGISSIERCCSGVPSINFIMERNQEDNVQFLHEQNCAIKAAFLKNSSKRTLFRKLEKFGSGSF